MKKLKIFYQRMFGPMLLNNDFHDYDEYWGGRGFHAPSKIRAKLLEGLVDQGSTILDVGCGDGTVMEHLKKVTRAKEVIGLDISAKAVEHVKSKGLEAHTIDALSPAFRKFLKGKEFDYIIITEVLEHVQDPEAVIVNIRDHAKKAVIISIPNTGFFIHRLRLLFGRFPMVVIQEHVKEHIRFWTHRDFKHWAHHYGYDIDKVVVTSGMGIKPLAFLETLSPALFGNQLMYRIVKK